MTVVRLFILCLVVTISICDENTTTSTSSSSSSSTTSTTISTTSTESGLDLDKIDLDKAETKDGTQKLEIIKQIRKINADGSYTIGYEAEDGTFKIESRDVLGNVKGTYGYVDDNGEIKRVSYTANNATGLKTMPVDAVSAETAQLLNRTAPAATTRRPNSVTPKTNVQSIPRRRYHNSNNKELSSESTTTLVYATSLSTPKPSGTSIRPTHVPYKSTADRPERFVEIASHGSKVAKNQPPPSTQNPIIQEEEKNGNHLRRQTSDHPENFETQQQVIYGQSAGDDNTHIYGNGPGDVTVRPLYQTTGSPRVPSAVLAARQRAAQLQNIISKAPTTTTEKVYVKPPKREDNKKLYEQSTEVSAPVRDINEGAEDERRIFRERPVGTYRPRQEYVRYIPTTAVVPAADQRQIYRMAPPIPPQGFRQPEPDPQQYLRETTRIPQRANYEEIDQNELDYGGNRRAPAPAPAPQASQYDPNQYQQSLLIPYPFQPQRQAPVDPYDRPLTTRDFERLLQLLIYRHQQLTQYQGAGRGGSGYPGVNPYYPQQPTQGYPPGGYYGYQIPRPPYYQPSAYDPLYENPAYSPSAPSRQQQQPQYAQQPQPQPSQEDPTREGRQYQTPPSNEAEQNAYYESQRTVPRRRMYYPARQGQIAPAPSQIPAYQTQQDYIENTNQISAPVAPHPPPPPPDYLPPTVREDLLYRMFMLALRAGPGPMPAASNLEPTTIEPVTSRKPVRSVQIIGEEDP